jgi:anaerobic ribonucleoside-triphosphate reductase
MRLLFVALLITIITKKPLEPIGKRRKEIVMGQIKITVCYNCFLCREEKEGSACPGCGSLEPIKRCRSCGRFVDSEKWVTMTPENIKLNKATLCDGCS